MENDVIKSLREDEMSPELQDHVAGCPVCHNLALVHNWMNRFEQNARKTDLSAKTLPTAEALWRRGRETTRPDKKLVKKALWPLLIPQTLFYGLILAGIVFFTIWGFQKFGHVLDSPVFNQFVPFFGILMIIVVVSLSFCAIVTAFDKRKHPA
jgi:hypothetical protein